MGRISAWLGLVWGLGLLAGISTTAYGQHYVFDSYRQREGLGNLAIASMAFDHEGFLWIATENGLYRFLGARFERYGKEQGLRERDIRDVFIDPAGRIWVGTQENLYVWNGRGFETFARTLTPIQVTKRIALLDPHHLLVIRGHELVEFTINAAGHALAEKPYFTKEQVQQMPELLEPTSVFRSGDGTVWMGCQYRICSSRDGRVRVWGAAEGVPELEVNQEFWRSFLDDRKGTLWAASEHHLLELDRGATRFVDRQAPGVELNGSTNASPIVEDGRGRILQVTNGGLARWSGREWRKFGVDDGLPSGTHISSLAFGGNGDLWIGGSGSGIEHWLGYGKWEGWTTHEGLPDDSIWAFAWRDATHLLIGTEKGPAQLDIVTHRITPLYATADWAFGQVSGLLVDRRGQVWASTWTGKVLRINPVSRKVVLAADIQYLSYNSVARPDGGLLFLTRQGIFALDHPEAGSAVHAVPEVDRLLGGKKAVIGACTAPNGDMWFLAENGVLRLRNGEWTRPELQGLTFHGAMLSAIRCGRNGTVWIDGMDAGQEPGLWRLEADPSAPGLLHNDPMRYRAVHIPMPDFVHALEVQSLLIDSRGWVWMGTDVGVAVWNGSQWRHFSQENGLIWNDTNQGVIEEGPGGSVWVGTSGGVAHMLHPDEVFEPAGLSVAILSIQRDNEEFLPGQKIVLPWSREPIRFHFAAAAWLNRSVVEYRYRIAGLNAVWITTPTPEATMPSLPAGHYRFEVVAHNRETGDSSAVAAAAFVVLAPWWSSYWFIGLCLTAAGLLLWMLLWLRTRSLIASQRRLEALVQQHTQELEESREALRIQATHDGLTGLFNHEAILRLLDQEMERARREHTLLAVLMLDLDHFKQVNDHYGHLAGDAALRAFAETIAKSIRPYDMAGRYGGEEFLLLVSNLRSEAVDERLARLHASLTNLRVRFGEEEILITCSIGVSFLRPDGPKILANDLLHTADRALYEAKRRGRNRVVQMEHTAGGEATATTRS